MSIKSIFKCSILNCSYFFKNGKQAAFLAGKFITDVPEEVKELTEEINNRHPHLYIDPNEKEIDTEALSPLEEMREKIRAELKAEMLAATSTSNDRGTSDGGKLTGIASSANTPEGVDAAEKAAQAAAAVGTITKPTASVVSAKLADLLKKQ